jgi:hypothetical protein
MESRAKSARDLLVEAVLIVGSILLAFAIDAAWEGIGTDREEAELLSALLSDFQRNQTLLEVTAEQHRSHRAAALDFLSGAAPAGTAPTEPVDDATLITLVSWTTYDPALGSLQAAIGSGQLSLISDPTLRAELAMWMDLVEDLNETEVADKAHADRFSAVAFRLVPFRSAVFRLGNPAFERASTATGDYGALWRSLEAENIATNRVAEIGFILADLGRVQQSLETIISLLQVDLE